MCFLIRTPIALGSCHHFTNLSCKLGVVWLVPSLPLVIRLCMGLLLVMFALPFISCCLNPVIIFCFLRTWSHCIALKSLRLHLVSFIGLLRGALFPSLICTVKLPELEDCSWCSVHRAAPHVLWFVHSILLFLWCFCRVFGTLVLLLSSCSECFALASVPYLLFISHVSFHSLSSCPFWFQLC